MTYRLAYLSNLAIDEEAEQQTVLIAERDGKRRFPIAIGQLEALAIDRALKGQIFPRPLTHDLLIALVRALHADVREVRITDLKGGTFHAELLLVRNDGTLFEMDCRPSDALAVLVRLPGTPLLVAEDVLAEAGG